MRWRGLRRSAALSATLLGGCALHAMPPPDLTTAQGILARVEVAPFAEAAGAELREAEAALTHAERAHAGAPERGETWDDAYVARRAAEKAAAAERYEAARSALLEARATTARLARELARREAFLEAAAARRASQARAQRAQREALVAALLRARAVARIDAAPDGVPMARFSAEELFLPGTSLLRDGAEARLGALAAALLGGPPFLVELAVLDDAEGRRTSPFVLADRRARRLRDALVEHGVPAGWFLPTVRRPPPGTQIDVRLRESDTPPQ